MQKIEQNPSLPALWLWLSVFLFFFAALPQPLWAQVNDPTALPTPADDELVVVAGGHGAVVYTADGAVVTPESLLAAGVLRHLREPIAILAGGELNKKLVISAHKFSKTATTRIEELGGTITTLEFEKTRKIR